MPLAPFTSIPVPGSPALMAAYINVAAPGGSGVAEISGASLLGNASATVTIGGTVATGNTVTATINGSASTATAAVSDTTTILATKLAAAINANASVNTVVVASAAGSVVTINSNATGTTGYYPLSTSATGGGATATASFTSLELANLVVPVKTFSYVAAGGSGPVVFYYNNPVYVDNATKADIRAQGLA